MERLLVDIKCLIHEAFLLCHPEPPWQTVLPSKKTNKMKGGKLVVWGVSVLSWTD